ncbi:MAG: flagellar basal body-associated FliL family protein [Pseudomonadota bacterium]
MAEAEAEATEEAPKGGKGKLIIAAVGGLVLMGAGVFLGPMITGMISPPPEPEVAEESDDAKPKPGAPAFYYPILPPLTSNFPDQQGRRRFIQVGLEVRASEQSAIDAVKEHNAVIRNALLLAYSELDYDAVVTRDGKEALRQTSLEEVRRVLNEQTGKPGVDDIFFTQFIIQ